MHVIHKIIINKKDLDTFHKIDDANSVKINNFEIFRTNINGFSFNLKQLQNDIN